MGFLCFCSLWDEECRDLHRIKTNFNSIAVLKPIETKNLTSADVEDLARDTRELMLKELVALTSRKEGKPIAMPAENGSGVVKASGAEAQVEHHIL